MDAIIIIIVVTLAMTGKGVIHAANVTIAQLDIIVMGIVLGAVQV